MPHLPTRCIHYAWIIPRSPLERWGQNRLQRNQRQKTSQENLLFYKMRKKSKKNGKNYQRSIDQLVETDKLDSPRESTRPFAELDQSSSANDRAGSTTGFSLDVRRAGPVQFGEWPSWIDHGIQLGRLPSWINQNPSAPRPCSSSSDIVSNSLLFCLGRRYRWNFTI